MHTERVTKGKTTTKKKNASLNQNTRKGAKRIRDKDEKLYDFRLGRLRVYASRAHVQRDDNVAPPCGLCETRLEYILPLV